MIGSASPSQRSRSGNPSPNARPYASCSVLEPGAADAEDRASAGDVVEGRRHLRGERRLAERVRPDHQSDPDPLRGLGPGGQRQPALEDRTVGAADDRVEVVPRPERVVAEAVGAAAGFEQAGQVVYWFQQSAPRRMSDMGSPGGREPDS